MDNDLIRIGTRKSPLAVWQAELVQKNLEQQGYRTELVLMISEGDIDLVTPLYAMGVQGVFTKVADTAPAQRFHGQCGGWESACQDPNAF